MKLLRYTAFIILISCFFTGTLTADIRGKTVSFGYIRNSTDRTEHNYLETILSNTFANTLADKYEVSTIKPAALEEVLQKSEKKLKRYHESDTLKDIISVINTEYFIYGSFTPLENNRIETTINVYHRNSGTIFSFTSLGRMQAEIFRLADRIVEILAGHLSDDFLFKPVPISPNSNLGIISNISGIELNTLYITIGMSGHTVKAVQGNTLYSEADEKEIIKFDYIRTERAYYDLTTDRNKLKYLYETWTEDRFDRSITTIRNIYRKYDLEYLKTKNLIMERFSGIYNIDYLFIINFNENRTSASLRCLDLKNKELIWIQKNIRGKDVAEITSVLTGKM